MSTTANRGPGVLSRFAHLVGAGKAKAEDVTTTEEHDELEDKVETVEDKVDDLEERIDDVEDKVDDEPTDPDEPGEDKPEARAAYRRGKAAGRKAEKARAGAIMGLKASASNLPLALHLAFETNSSPKAALGTLQASQAGMPKAPAAAGKRGLDARMGGAKPITVGAEGSAAAGKRDISTPEGASDFVLATLAHVRGTKKGA